MINRKIRASICALMIGLGLQAPTVSAVETVWRFLPQFPLDYTSKVKWLDLDGDGINEVVVNGRSASGITGVLKQSVDGLKLVDIHVNPWLTGGFVPVVDDGGAARLMVASGGLTSSRFYELAGIPLRVVRELSFDFPARPLVYVDIDGDGHPEVVELNPYSSPRVVRLIDYATGLVKWSHTVQGAASSLVVAQLDDDAPLEIILTSSLPGLVLSGDDGSVEWSYAPGFGGEVHAGRFQNDPQIRTFAARGEGAVVFRSQPYSPLYDLFPGPFGPRGAGTVYDVNGDGLDELVLAPERIEPVFRAYDMGTGQLVGSWSSSFVDSIAASFGRFQPGSPLLLAYGSSFGATTPPVGMEVRTFPEGDIVYQDVARSGPHNRVAAADVDGDGQTETIVAIGRTAQSVPANPTVELMVFSGDSEPDAYRHLDGLSWAASSNAGVLMTVADLRGEGAMDIVLASGDRIVAVDGATLETRWERHATAQSDLAGLTGVALTSVDFDGDGVADVALLMEDSEFGQRVVALSGLTGQTLWKSLAMSGLASSRSLLVAQIDADAADELIVTLGQTFFVFDTLSKELEWVRLLNDWSATSAVVVRQWPNCHLGLVETGAMRVFDCQTRTLVETVMLPSQADFVRGVDAQGDVLLTEGQGRLYALKRAGGRYFQSPLSAPVGVRLSAVPDKMFPAPNEGQVVDVLVGTAAYPARLRVDLANPIWASGFER